MMMITHRVRSSTDTHQRDIPPITAKHTRPLLQPSHGSPLIPQAKIHLPAAPLPAQEPKHTEPIRHRHGDDAPRRVADKRAHGAVQRTPEVESPAVEEHDDRQRLLLCLPGGPEHIQPQRRLGRVLRHGGWTPRRRLGCVQPPRQRP